VAATQTGPRADISSQQVRDHGHPIPQDTLIARMGAVLGAQEARARREQGADSTFRQSLIDLAAIAELIADELPPPVAAPR
jgi:hypothetical protein